MKKLYPIKTLTLKTLSLLLCFSFLSLSFIDNAFAKKKTRSEICASTDPRPDCILWTDAVVLQTSATAKVKAQHIMELREQLDLRRLMCNLPGTITWTDGDLRLTAPDDEGKYKRKKIRTTHILELRDQVAQFVNTVANDPKLAPSYKYKKIQTPVFEAITSTTPIRNSDIVDLRNLIDDTFCKVACKGSWTACVDGSQTFNIQSLQKYEGEPCSYAEGATRSCI